MPKITFSSENTKRSDFDFPKLKLVKDERARLAFVEPNPEFEYQHRLQIPQLADGVPVMEVKQNRKNENYETNKLDFISTPICTGNLEVLEDKGIDPDNCIMCKYAAETGHTSAPARRFAIHVVRYATKPNSFEIALPFRVENIVWSFTDQIFNKVTEFAEAWKDDGGLQSHDILMGPCTNAAFQKAELAIAPTAEWRKDKERVELVKQTIRENRAKDLSVFCGSKISDTLVQGHLDRIEGAWNEIKRFEARGAQGSPAQKMELDAGLSNLLESTPAASQQKQTIVDMDDLLGTGTVEAKPTTKAIERDEEGWVVDPEIDAKLAPRETVKEVEDFGSLDAIEPDASAAAPAEEPAAEDDEFADFLSSL